MEHNLENTISVLARTPATLDALLRDLPDTWTLGNEGESTRSAFDVVGHLIHGERTDWIPCAKRILEFGETRAFEPFDRWAQMRESEGKQLGELLDEFARLRSSNLAELRALNLQPKDLERHQAVEKAVGREVSPSTVHRLPRRYGWHRATQVFIPRDTDPKLEGSRRRPRTGA